MIVITVAAANNRIGFSAEYSRYTRRVVFPYAMHFHIDDDVIVVRGAFSEPRTAAMKHPASPVRMCT